MASEGGGRSVGCWDGVSLYIDIGRVQKYCKISNWSKEE